MRRSLFRTFFVRMMLGLGPFAVLAAVLAWRRGYAEASMLGFAAFLLLLFVAAFSYRRLVRQGLVSLQAMTEALPGRSAASEETGLPKHDQSALPKYSEFDGLVDSIAGVSARQRGELKRVSDERRQLEALLDSMQDAVVAVDAASRIQWTNRQMQQWVPGATASGAVRVGHALVETVRDPEVLACVRGALESREVCQRRTTSLVPGRIFEVNASPMPAGGALAVIHDITRVEEMERTQRDFVANVSHELRTPLTSIGGYVETLLDMQHRDGEQMLSPVAREFLATILKNATRMGRLTEDLLTMARAESREAAIHPRPVRADRLVQDAVAAMRGIVQQADADLEVGETTAVEVFADPDAMVQVLGNLIENGIRYGQPNSAQRCRVRVSAREILTDHSRGSGTEQGASVDSAVVEFSVRDFGPGIASEHLTRVFERFYRVDKARSRESGGTGLGLAIARRMVEMQGGTIRVESTLGAGSDFVVRLARARSIVE